MVQSAVDGAPLPDFGVVDAPEEFIEFTDVDAFNDHRSPRVRRCLRRLQQLPDTKLRRVDADLKYTTEFLDRQVRNDNQQVFSIPTARKRTI